MSAKFLDEPLSCETYNSASIFNSSRLLGANADRIHSTAWFGLSKSYSVRSHKKEVRTQHRRQKQPQAPPQAEDTMQVVESTGISFTSCLLESRSLRLHFLFGFVRWLLLSKAGEQVAHATLHFFLLLDFPAELEAAL